MFDEFIRISLFWTFLYAFLSGFFIIIAIYFDRRPFIKFSILLAMISLVAISEFVAGYWVDTKLGFFLIQVPLWVFAFAPALHSDFLISNYKISWGKKWVSLGYICAISALLADLIITLLQLDQEKTLAVPSTYLSQSPVVSGFVGILLVAHLGLGMVAYESARKTESPRASYLLATLALCIPFIVIDFWVTGETGVNHVLSESVIWLYGLVHLGVLLADTRGQKGLLKRTADSLVQTTQQLQHSYAELEQVQSELEKKEQLAAVGELAATIAHEVRNPLAVIKNAVSGLRRKTISPQDQDTLLAIVDEEAERLNQLVSELLRFARPIDISCASVSMLSLLDEICHEERQYRKPQVVHPGVELGNNAWLDSELFQVALENLLMNAEQAMQENLEGKISIELGATLLKDGRNALLLSVSDEGPGMSKQEKELAMKPFHTTRPRGSGLGLPIVERIVQAHGGEMTLQDAREGGCRIELSMPLSVQ